MKSIASIGDREISVIHHLGARVVQFLAVDFDLRRHSMDLNEMGVG